MALSSIPIDLPAEAIKNLQAEAAAARQVAQDVTRLLGSVIQSVGGKLLVKNCHIVNSPKEVVWFECPESGDVVLTVK